jgi:hypothetical protein
MLLESRPGLQPSPRVCGCTCGRSQCAAWLKMQLDYDLTQIARAASKINVRRVASQPA